MIIDDNAAIMARADSAAVHWLRRVGLSTQPLTIAMLVRATAPRAHGFTREALVLPDPGSMEEDVVAALLRAGQVPTQRAVLAALNQADTRRLPAKGAAAADLKRFADRWHEHIDALGAVVSAEVEGFWLQSGYGPLRREAFGVQAVSVFAEAYNLARPSSSQLRSILCAELHRAGWLVSNQTQRSLCAGPTYFAFARGESRRRSPQEIGQRVGRSIGSFRFRHHRSPTWTQLASSTMDARGRRIFESGADAHAQSTWLLTQEWIRFENGEIRRGARAKAETAKRSAERRKNWERRSVDRKRICEIPGNGTAQ